MKLRVFCLAQPLLLLAVVDFETDICRWAAIHRPQATAQVYGVILDWFQVLAAIVHPALGKISHTGPWEACRQVHLFALFFTGFIFPAIVIWRLEKQTWREFLKVDAQALVWPDGPSVRQLDVALEELREEERGKVKSEKPGVRLAAVLLIASAFSWKALDMVAGKLPA